MASSSVLPLGLLLSTGLGIGLLLVMIGRGNCEGVHDGWVCLLKFLKHLEAMFGFLKLSREL